MLPMKLTNTHKTVATIALAGILLLGLLSGCAAPPDAAEPHRNETQLPSTEPENPHGPDEGIAGNAEPERDEETASSEQNGESPHSPAEPEQEAEPHDEQEQTGGETVKTHYMNNNYFVKPIEEDGDKRVVLLTFDDGPKEEALLVSILDTLDRHGAKAIFFVNGFRVKQNPDLLQLIDERGHAVGNHSYEHIVLRQQPEDVIDRQLSDVQTLVNETIGKAPRFFRPPNGAGNDYIKEKAAELGMLYMNWSNGSLDWADNRNDPDGVIRSVMDQLNPGSIILMHELSWTAEALDDMLGQIQAEGYTFLDPHALEEEAR